MTKVKHITAGYTGTLLKEYKNGNALIAVEHSDKNEQVFESSNFPFQIKARNYRKYFNVVN